MSAIMSVKDMNTAERKAYRRCMWLAFWNGMCLWRPTLTEDDFLERFRIMLAEEEHKEMTK